MSGVGVVLLFFIFPYFFLFLFFLLSRFSFLLYFSCLCVLFFCHLFNCFLLFLSVYIL
jgi:hypothetical protein